jgi:hypothetical protein
MLARFSVCRSGAAAAEMALVAPMLLIILFGCFELGHYFQDQHVVTKAVRDGARYAARLPISNYSACTGSPGTAVVDSVARLVTRGTLAEAATTRLPYWEDTPPVVNVTIRCVESLSVGAGAEETMSGIYAGLDTGAAIVTVSATVEYSSLFGSLGFETAGLTLGATAESPVAGI